MTVAATSLLLFNPSLNELPTWQILAQVVVYLTAPAILVSSIPSLNETTR